MRILFCAAATGGFLSDAWVELKSGLSRREGGSRGLRARLVEVVSLEERAPALPAPVLRLLDDLGDHARADRAAALADREAQALVHGDGLDQLDLHLDVVTRHDHLGALGQPSDAGDVRGAEVELRAVAREE